MIQSVTNSNSDVRSIAQAIFNKNRLAFRYRRGEVARQARYFAPAYRDFILKVINNNSLKITDDHKDSYTMDIDENESPSYKRKRKIKVVSNIRDIDALPHELGHAADFWFGRDISLSTTVLVDGNKTLYDVFAEEFEEKHEEIYEVVMNEYKHIIDSTIKEGAYQILSKKMPRYCLLLSIEPDFKDKRTTKERRGLQRELDESGFTEVYYQFVMKSCYQTLNTKYAPILDALSARHNFSGFFLIQHSSEYYDLDDNRLVFEFFANLFGAKVTGKHAYVDHLIKYLPRSFNAFERLFVIFYDHIQNNKKFNDVKTKKELN